MYRNKGKLLTAVLAVFMTLTLVACGGKAGEGKGIKDVISSAVDSIAASNSAQKSENKTASESSGTASSETKSDDASATVDDKTTEPDTEPTLRSETEKLEYGAIVSFYSEDGKKVKEERYRVDEMLKYVVEFDEYERAVSTTEYDPYSGQVREVINYEYDSNNNIYIVDGPKRTYNEAGYLLSENEDTFYSYDKLGRLEKEEKSASSSSWYDKSECIYTYDENNRVIETVKYFYTSSGEQLDREVTTYTYSSDGRSVEIRRVNDLTGNVEKQSEEFYQSIESFEFLRLPGFIYDGVAYIPQH